MTEAIGYDTPLMAKRTFNLTSSFFVDKLNWGISLLITLLLLLFCLCGFFVFPIATLINLSLSKYLCVLNHFVISFVAISSSVPLLRLSYLLAYSFIVSLFISIAQLSRRQCSR